MMHRRTKLGLVAGAILGAAMILPDIQDVARGRLTAAYWPWAAPAWRAPDVVTVGVHPDAQRWANIDKLREPRILPPLICGRYEVARIWSRSWGHIFSGVLRNGNDSGTDGVLAFTMKGPGWQRLLGIDTYTGQLELIGSTALTARPSGSLVWKIGTGSLLCIDSDETSNGNTNWTWPAGQTVTYRDGGGVVYVDGALTITSGASISVTMAPPYYPAILVEAKGGITGSITAGSLPSGYQLVQDSSFIRLDKIP